MTIQVISRSDWGAAAPRGPYTKHVPKRVTAHHVAGLLTKDFAGNVTIQAIQSGHQKPPAEGGRGFIDIGYHYIIAPDGSVYQGRPETVVGAHVANDNTGNIGISFYGNFDKEDPTEAQLASFTQLAAEVMDRHNIPMSEFYFHFQRASTDCPGSRMRPRHEELRSRVNQYRLASRDGLVPTVTASDLTLPVVIPSGGSTTPVVPLPQAPPPVPVGVLVMILLALLFWITRD